MQDPLPVRLGNIASELNRLANRVSAHDPDERIVASLSLIPSMMDWMGQDSTRRLADMQREICRWRRIWPVEAARSMLAFRARRMSEDLLETSGLLS
jgi:hypothetical protein